MVRQYKWITASCSPRLTFQVDAAPPRNAAATPSGVELKRGAMPSGVSLPARPPANATTPLGSTTSWPFRGRASRGPCSGAGPGTRYGNFCIHERRPRSRRLKYSSRPARNSSAARPGIAGGLRNAVVFADFLVVDAAAEQGQGRIVRRAAAAAAGIRAAAAAALRIDALRLQQQLDGFGLGGDGRRCRFPAEPECRSLSSITLGDHVPAA